MMARRKDPEESVVRLDRLTIAFGENVIQRDLDFEIVPGTIFAIMGPSGCGKSTLLRHMIGLHEPAAGRVFLWGEDFWALEQYERNRLLQEVGVLFQGRRCGAP